MAWRIVVVLDPDLSPPHPAHTRVLHPQAEMKRITNSPLFKEAMEQAQEMTKELQNDPEKMAAFMQDLQVGGCVGGFPVCMWGGGKGRDGWMAASLSRKSMDH